MANFEQIKSIYTSKIGSMAGKAVLNISVEGSSEVYWNLGEKYIFVISGISTAFTKNYNGILP